MVYTAGLKPAAARHTGSSPVARTSNMKIYKSRRKKAKAIYRIGSRCQSYDSNCCNCFRFKYLDTYGAFPTGSAWTDYFSRTR